MTLRIVLSVVIVASALAVAHFFRFVPLPGGEALQYTPMWDRWFQRVCVVSFAGGNQVSCSMEVFSGQFSKPKEVSAQPITKIEQARRAGFSEKEILEYMENQ